MGIVVVCDGGGIRGGDGGSCSGWEMVVTVNKKRCNTDIYNHQSAPFSTPFYKIIPSNLTLLPLNPSVRPS